MKDKAGFFAGCADILTAMCIYYVVAGIFIMASRGWGLHLFWLLICPVICAWIFARLLRKPRSTTILTVVTVILFIAMMAVFLVASTTPPKFGYVFMLAIGCGMGVGLPLYYALHRPLVHRHLTYLDVLVMAVLVLLLCKQAMGIDNGTVVLTVIVLLMDAAGAVGLRMTDGDGANGGSAIKATLVALVSAIVVMVIIGLLTALFSRSGEFTGNVIQGIGSLFAALGSAIARFFQWFANLVKAKDKFEAVPVEDGIESVAGIEGSSQVSMNVNTTVVGIVICVVVVAIIVAVALIFRKKSFTREMRQTVSASQTVVHREGGSLAALWHKLMAAIRFRWTAFVRRDTPSGLLVILERKGRRLRTPRQTGESIRHFIQRMDASGGLDPLADALDLQFYGGKADSTMTAKQCREMRRYMRKAVSHG